MKLKTLVAAVAFVVAGAANAAISNDAAGGSSLVFEAWDSTSGQGFVQNIGTKLDAFLNANTGSINLALNAAGFATLLGADTAGANLQWHIFATKTGATAVSGDGVLTTIPTGGLPSAALDVFGMPALEIAMDGHITDIKNAIGATADFGNIASTNVAYGGLFGTDYSGNLNGQSVKGGFGAIDFYSIASDTATNSVRVDTKQPFQFKLDSAGNLSYQAAAAAVPLPAAVWLFGSGLLGLIGIGRRRNAA